MTYKMCDHFRFPYPVGQDKFIYLSSSRGYRQALAKEDIQDIDFGVYLDGTWKYDLAPSKSEVMLSEGFREQYSPVFSDIWDSYQQVLLNGIYLPWYDRGAPPLSKLNMLLDWINPLIDQGKRIEIACMGGHGRTGTLAVCIKLSRLKGDVKPSEVIKELRETYCKEAVESWTQVERIYEVVGMKAPPEPKSVQTYVPPQMKLSVAVASNTRDLNKWLRQADTVWERLPFLWNDRERWGVYIEQSVLGYGEDDFD